MFDDLILELDSLKEFKYEMKIMSDEEGYVDKECPREECLKKFKISVAVISAISGIFINSSNVAFFKLS